MNLWYTDNIIGSIYFMRKDKAVAIKLRKSGHSYGQISSKLGIPKSTLSTWLRDIKLSKSAQLKISDRVNNTSIKALIQRNKDQTGLAQKRHESIKHTASKNYYNYNTNSLFLIGVSLYWAEGYKKGAIGSKWKSVDFANSDPKMIILIINFFEKYLNVTKTDLKVQIIAHKNVDEKKSLLYWSNITRIPLENFMKVSYTKNNSKNTRKINTIPYGTVHIRINDVTAFFTLIGWIDEMKKNV